MDAPPAFRSSSPSPSSSNASVPMVVITVVGILAAFALLASYYAFVTKCQALRGLWSRGATPWRGHGGGGAWRRAAREASVIRTVATEERGLGMPFIRMLPVVRFTAAACAGGEGGGGGVGARISVSECAVCLSEFVERERVRLLPNCSHAFHIDCIDTWLQGNARCPFCRSDVTLPFTPPPAAAPVRPTSATHPDDEDVESARRRHHHHHHNHNHRPDDELISSIVIEVRGEHESWPESVGDEAIDTRKKYDEEFAVQPMRRSLSMDSCHKHLYVSVQEFLTQQRQV
uniref:RING-type E3 ubiquitin transferase n=1 Tax=Oryza meridionalis TaxID=40149 RepID=A0A0E0CV87_9ORYZ